MAEFFVSSPPTVPKTNSHAQTNPNQALSETEDTFYFFLRFHIRISPHIFRHISLNIHFLSSVNLRDFMETQKVVKERRTLEGPVNLEASFLGRRTATALPVWFFAQSCH